MLTDQVKELLTAFVDGELSQRQRKAVTRLLHRSSEARELVKQLQENAHKIKKLPRRKVEPSLVDDVLQVIAEQQLQPKQPAAPRRARRWLPFVAAGLAASLLIATASIVYWQSLGGPDVNPPIAENKKPDVVIPPKKKFETPPKQPNPLLARMVDETFGGFATPVVIEKPFVASFSDLRKGDQGATAGQLTHELNRGKLVQLDITVKNNSMAIDQLRRALKDRGINVVIDPTAGKTLTDKKQAKVEYLVYAENFTSDELTKLMGDLSQPVMVGINNQKTAPSPFTRLAIEPAAKEWLARVLGVEPSAIEPPMRVGKPDPKRERSAVLLPTTAGLSPSAEVRQFVSQRRPQPGTLQVLIKIRQE